MNAATLAQNISSRTPISLSPIFRRSWWTTNLDPPTEGELQTTEKAILEEVRRWGLHSGRRGRLTALELLATLQHFGAPTRLIDISFSPFVGAFFAAEESLRDGLPDADVDGRLFAVNVTNRLLDEETDKWLTDARPAWFEDNTRPDWWSGSVRAWRPPGFEQRIAAQHGGFLLGGVPTAGPTPVWPKAPNNADVRWNIAEHRTATSIAARVHKLDAPVGPQPGQAIYTIKIAAAAKPAIRTALKRLHSIDHSVLFPDFEGLAQFGGFKLRTRAPN